MFLINLLLPNILQGALNRKDLTRKLKKFLTVSFRVIILLRDIVLHVEECYDD